MEKESDKERRRLKGRDRKLTWKGQGRQEKRREEKRREEKRREEREEGGC